MAGRLTRAVRGAKRFWEASYGAATAVRIGVPVKDAFGALTLAISPHTAGNDHAPGLDYEGALRIVIRARREGLDFFDLWLIFDGYVCDDLNEAVSKLRAMHRTYEQPPPRS